MPLAAGADGRGAGVPLAVGPDPPVAVPSAGGLAVGTGLGGLAGVAMGEATPAVGAISRGVAVAAPAAAASLAVASGVGRSVCVGGAVAK
ncbi:MAG TPA: hypothetical protein VG370_32125, partial [Chloroflexota bacterium]|nr:hypothetical protein [Chloroflexota bacterium]